MDRNKALPIMIAGLAAGFATYVYFYGFSDTVSDYLGTFMSVVIVPLAFYAGTLSVAVASRPQFKGVALAKSSWLWIALGGLLGSPHLVMYSVWVLRGSPT